jgi:hypothetical protein
MAGCGAKLDDISIALVSKVKQKVPAHGIVIQEVSLDLIGFVAQGKDILVEAMGRKDAHDVPDDRPAADFDKFFLGQGLAAHTRALTTA